MLYQSSKGINLIYDDFTFAEEVFSPLNGFIKGEIKFKNGNHLSFIEVIDTEQNSKIKYRYHYMDKDKNLVFRYDNANHHKQISTFPHHKHTSRGIEASEEPTIETVMAEIINHMTTSF